MEVHKERVLDLDVIGERSPRSGDGLRYWWRRLGVSARVPTLAALGMFLLGGVVGGVGTHNWDLSQQLQVEESTASVVVLADTTGSMMAGSDGQRVRIDGQVTVVNAGPRSLNIRDLAADEHGVTLRATEKQRWIRPGGWSTVDVTATLDCATGVPAGPIALRISVQTEDERSSEVPFPIALQGTRWAEFVHRTCVRTG